MDRSCRSKERNPAGLSCRQGPVPRKGFNTATAELGKDCTGGVRKRAMGKGVGREHQGRRGRRGSRDERVGGKEREGAGVQVGWSGRK